MRAIRRRGLGYKDIGCRNHYIEWIRAHSTGGAPRRQRAASNRRLARRSLIRPFAGELPSADIGGYRRQERGRRAGEAATMLYTARDSRTGPASSDFRFAWLH